MYNHCDKVVAKDWRTQGFSNRRLVLPHRKYSVPGNKIIYITNYKNYSHTHKIDDQYRENFRIYYTPSFKIQKSICSLSSQ